MVLLINNNIYRYHIILLLLKNTQIINKTFKKKKII